MILSLPQIKEILSSRPNQGLLQKATMQSALLRRHIYGGNLKSASITEIKGYEKEEMRELRDKYAKSNKDLFSRLARPIDKVFSAKGGSIYFNLSEEQNKKAMALLKNVRSGLTAKKWIEAMWKPHFLDDPNGLIFMEIGTDAEDNIKCYPTYKSTADIYDYQPNGSNVEYVVFTTTKEERAAAGLAEADTAYRVFDDAFDYFVKWNANDKSAIIIQKSSYPNYFDKVPAILMSDMMSSTTPGLALSLFNEVMELAEDFITTGSIRNLAKIRMAYPKYWEYADDCNHCGGTGVKEAKPCEHCKGSGMRGMTNPGDAKLLSYPGSKDDMIVTPNIAGFVDFPSAYFDNSANELYALENLATLTIWGTEAKVQTQGLATSPDTQKTATQVIDEIQPKADRLHAISEMAEKRHKFIIDHIIQCELNQNYEGASVNYGRRYMIESADALWVKYQDARKNGAAISLLDELLMEYTEAKYANDPVGLAIQKKLIEVEPFVHYTAKETKDLAVPFKDFNAKIYFGEWLATVTDSYLLITDTATIKAALDAYVAAKGLVEPQPAAVVV